MVLCATGIVARIRRSPRGDPRGKLIWAGQAWAKGTLSAPTGSHQDRVNEARRFGFDLAADDFDVLGAQDGIWPWHVAALEAFLCVDTQWRINGGSERSLVLGLDYTAVQAGLALADITPTPNLFAQLRIIERAAAAAINGNAS